MHASSEDTLYLRFLGSLIEELGAKMYPSVTASVAELVSNAWDADAKNVWITMPLGRSITSDGGDEIVVIDDGIGMSRDETESKYLIVGRKRRSDENTWKSPSGRPLHGRKGVGKLAAFGTAKRLECTTITKASLTTTFLLDYDEIRKLEAGQDYLVPELKEIDFLIHPEKETPLEQGTQVRLSNLRGKRIPAESRFRASLARRFGVLSPDMAVYLNGTQIERFEIPLDIRFPGDAIPTPGRGLPRRNPETGEATDSIVVREGWAIESFPEGELSWWIGFTQTPIEAADLRGIAVLAHRKLVQRPFMFGRSQGTAGQLGQEYLVGEVIADWIDDSIQSENDLVEPNRNELQLEDERLQSFLEWGRARLRWALARRNDIRRTKINAEIDLDPEVQSRLEKFTPREQTTFKNIARQLAGLPEISMSAVTGLMNSVMDAHDDRAVREMIERIEEEDDPTQQRMWSLVKEFGLIDARRTATKVQARIEVIDKLAGMVEGGAPEIPDIHNHLRDNPWLLDPRWELYGDEVDLGRMLRNEFGHQPEGQGHRADYLFAIGPSGPTAADEVVVVEIKRGTNSDGSTNNVSLDEVNKLLTYIGAAEEYYERANSPANQPIVKGLMVASGYTAGAQRARRKFEMVPGYIYQFKSWASVLRDTERLHRGWLELSSHRARSAS